MNFNRLNSIHLSILILLFVHVSSQAIDCPNAKQIQCGVGICAGYQFVNNKCTLQQPICSSTQYFANATNTCLSCLSLDANSCGASCSSYSFFTNKATVYISSGPLNGCQSCEDAFGIGCKTCTSTSCTSCDSIATLNQTQNKCQGTICRSSIGNCFICGSATTCKLCLQGYDLNVATFGCDLSALNCKIKYCLRCQSATNCSGCYTGYKLSSNRQICEPQCLNSNCNNCLYPGVCGGCQSGYILNPQTSTCHLNCSNNDVTNCHSCNNLHICLSCNQGYHLIFQGTQCHRDCTVANCLTCSPLNVCNFCATGYRLSGTTCVQDICRIEYCSQCSSSSTCKSCFVPFQINSANTTCVTTCTNNCIVCEPATSSCTSCQTGYRKITTTSTSGNTTTTVTTCSRLCTISNCLTCFTASICSQCQSNYRLSTDAKSCKLVCVDNCDTCLSSTACSICNSGYSVSGNNCAPICLRGEILILSACVACTLNEASCLTCQNNNDNKRCTSCVDGFYLDASFNCKRCDTIVSSCTLCSGGNSFTCLRCASPNRLAGGVCVFCDEILNCQNCQAGNRSACANCTTGFSLVNKQCVLNNKTCPDTTILIDGVCKCTTGAYLLDERCIACQLQCVSCSQTACLQCVHRYFPIGQRCSPCDANCVKCTSATFCTQCTDETNLKDGKCISSGALSGVDNGVNVVLCQTGCSSCYLKDSTTICSEVDDGYALVNGISLKCDSICRTCSNSNPSICTSCYQGFAIQNGQLCVACSDVNALACSPTNRHFSTGCRIGFTLKGSPGLCVACTQNCRKCDIADTGRCDQQSCQVGYFLEDSLQCVNCFDNCPHCDSNNPSICLRCDQNRYLTSDAKCLKCADTCKFCTSAVFCTQCFPGFVLIIQGSIQFCVATPEFPCAQLRHQTLQCSKCYGNYILNTNQVCVYDSSCNNTKTCTFCENGLHLLLGQCFTCILSQGCRRCTATNSCQRCHDRFFLTNGICNSCQSGCLTCTNQNFCTRSDPGKYIRVDNKLTPIGKLADCQSPCKTCENFDHFCTSCIDEYQINGAKCFSLKLVNVNVVYVPRNGFYVETDTPEVKLSNAYRNLYQIKKEICASLPATLREGDDQICSRILVITLIRIGSINVEFKVDTNKIGTSPQAQTTVVQSINSNGIGGSIVKVSSPGTQGYTEGSNNLSLGLILGVSIPLGIIFILIIIFVIHYNRSSTDQEDEKDIYYEEVNQDNHYNV